MTRLAVLGSPIEHSKSPLLHRVAYAELGVDWSYGSHEVDAAGLEAYIGTLGSEWRGLSLTMPLKQEALRLADTADDIARKTGAVNTLRLLWSQNERTLHGYNTDVAGIVNALTAAGVDAVHRAVILGAGATAASALVAIADLGALEVDILARNPGKAAGLRDLAHALGLVVNVAGLARVAELGEADLVVSTLPGGADAGIEWPTSLVASSALLDVAYDPWPSAIARRWEQAGSIVANGLAMLVHQAVIQVRIFAADDPFAALDDEQRIVRRMLASVGLDETGRPSGS